MEGEEGTLEKAGGEGEVLSGCIFTKMGRMGSLWIAVSIRRQREMEGLGVWGLMASRAIRLRLRAFMGVPGRLVSEGAVEATVGQVARAGLGVMVGEEAMGGQATQGWLTGSTW